MNRKVFALLSVGLVAALMGCEPSSSKKSKSSGTNSSSIGKMEHDDHGHEAGHGHGAGPNGGTLADWGGGKFHVEFTVDHDKKETVVYILGSDEKTLTPVKAADGKLLLSIKQPAFQVELASLPMEGESNGLSSRYVGKHEKLGVVQEFAGSIGGEVDGTPYAGEFQEEPHGDHSK